jgi:DNA-binding Xre family transcriptional regulator
MSISLGEVIRRKIRDDRRSAQEICNELGMSRGNLDKIYKKDSINTDLLAKLCVLLQFDFFEYVNPFRMAGADVEPKYLASEDAETYRTPMTRLQKCMGELQDTTKELDRVEQEVVYLRSANRDKEKIIGLQQDQIDYLKRKLEGL